MPQLTTEEFIAKAKLIYGDKYDYSETQYTRLEDKITFRCPRHGQITVTASHHLNNKTGCLTCPREDSFLNKAKKLNPHYDYSLVDYKKSSIKVKIICPKHGVFEQRPNNHLNGEGCPKCAFSKKLVGIKKPKYGNRVIDICPELAKEYSDKNLYDFSVYNKGSSKRVIWKCTTCKYEWETSIVKRTTEKNGCPACSGRVASDKNRLTIINPKVAQEWDYEKNNDKPEDYTYSSNKQKRWKCLKCNHSWKTSINARNKSGCPKCKKSWGEKTVEYFIEKKNIIYQSQYRIEECRNKNPLPFDFAILDEDNNLMGLIEYNGEQHYKIRKHNKLFGSKELLKYTKTNDKIKLKFCKKSKIPLLIIPYTEFNNIEQITEKFLYDIGAIKDE